VKALAYYRNHRDSSPRSVATDFEQVTRELKVIASAKQVNRKGNGT
jgi:hypothetical protein